MQLAIGAVHELTRITPGLNVTQSVNSPQPTNRGWKIEVA